MAMLSITRAFKRLSLRSRGENRADKTKSAVDQRQDSVHASLIGNSAAAPLDALDVEDDEQSPRSKPAAGSSLVTWQICTGCAFLVAEHERECQVCGTVTPFSEQHGPSIDGGINALEHIGYAVPHAAVAKPSPHSKVQTATMCQRSSSVSTEAATNETDSESTYDVSDGLCSEHDSDAESAIYISGTLDVAPPVGTEVKILFDDDEWHFAIVVARSGVRAKVRFEDGDRRVVNFESCAVRSADYSSDDERSVSGDEIMETTGDSCYESNALLRHERLSFEDRSRRLSDTDNVGIHVQSEQGDSEDEGAYIPDTLDTVPPVGTLVIVLHEDAIWYPARIIASNGTIGRVLNIDGTLEDLDFSIYAVRLMDNMDEYEEIGADGDHGHVGERVQSAEDDCDNPMEDCNSSSPSQEVDEGSLSEVSDECLEVDDKDGQKDRDHPTSGLPSASVLGRTFVENE